MDDLNSFKEKLEANLLTLNKFEGLETDLIQQHGNLRAQFSEYREAIETTNLNEKEKREHYGYHDELVKKLHKLILEAKALARKRTEQMTRDELFKLSQERQKSLKPQSAEDKIGDEVTKSLKRMLETMRTEVERSSSNISTAHQTTKNLHGTTGNYDKLSGTLEQSRGLIRELWKKNRNDMIYIIGALGVFIATATYVILQRTPGIVWLPGKLILRQLGNLVPKSSGRAGKFMERVVEMTEAVLSDSEDAPDMFVDRILKREKEYGNDDLLKEEYEDKVFEPVIIENSEPERIEVVSSEEDSSTATEEHVSATAEVRTIDEPKIENSVETSTFSVKSSQKIMQTKVMAVKEDVPETHNVIETSAEMLQEDPLIFIEKFVETDANNEKEIREPAAMIEKDVVPDDAGNAQNIDANIAQVSKPGHARTEAQNSDEVTIDTTPKSPAITKVPIATVAPAIISEVPAISTEKPTATKVDEVPTVAVETPVITETSAVTFEPHVPAQFTPAIEVLAAETVAILSIVPTVTETPPHSEAQDSPATITPTAAKIMTESTYYTATESEFEGTQGIYSSETELFSENEEKMEL